MICIIRSNLCSNNNHPTLCIRFTTRRQQIWCRLLVTISCTICKIQQQLQVPTRQTQHITLLHTLSLQEMSPWPCFNGTTHHIFYFSAFHSLLFFLFAPMFFWPVIYLLLYALIHTTPHYCSYTRVPFDLMIDRHYSHHLPHTPL